MLLEIPDAPLAPRAQIDFTAPREDLRGAEADLKLLFTKSNRILIQDIFAQPFTDPVVPPVLAEAQGRLGGPAEFKIVTARLTCLPSPECRFTWLRIGFALGRAEQKQSRPIACTLYPTSRQDSLKITSSVEISGELTIKVVKAGAKRQQGVEHERREFAINAYGAFSSMPAWDFQKTEVNPEVTGDLTLVMVVAQPPSAFNEGCLSVSARAELRSGSVIALVIRRTEQNAASLTFTI